MKYLDSLQISLPISNETNVVEFAGNCASQIFLRSISSSYARWLATFASSYITTNI
jgi:hypothetical protein